MLRTEKTPDGTETLTTHSEDTFADDTLNSEDTETLTTHCANRFAGQIYSLHIFFQGKLGPPMLLKQTETITVGARARVRAPEFKIMCSISIFIG